MRLAAALTQDRTNTSPHAELIQMAVAIWKSRAIYAAAELGIADLIAEGTRHTEALAARTGMHSPSLYRLLRALAGCGLVTETKQSCFELTELGAALRKGAPGAAHATVLTLAGGWQWKAWDEFLFSLRTGLPSLSRLFGKTLFEYLAENPADSALFNQAMIGMHGNDGPALAGTYDFSRFKTVVDLGGGTGSILAAILTANEHLEGVLVELPQTVSQGQALMGTHGLASRCKVIAGDFFKSVPAGDIYVLSHVLHDWSDDQAMTILRNCRRAIRPGGRLLIVESVLPDGDAPHPGKLMDLLMLVVTGGVERTAAEFAALLSETGFDLTEVSPISPSQSVLEAAPAVNETRT